MHTRGCGVANTAPGQYPQQSWQCAITNSSSGSSDLVPGAPSCSQSAAVRSGQTSSCPDVTAMKFSTDDLPVQYEPYPGVCTRQPHLPLTDPDLYGSGSVQSGTWSNSVEQLRTLSAPSSGARRSEPPDSSRRDKRDGYRRLWQQVSRINRGDKLSQDAGSAFVDVTVEDLLRVVTGLLPSESAIPALERGLHCLDSSAMAALLKELARQGHVKRAVEIFDWLRGLEEGHELARLCDVYTYTTMISQCGSHQQLRRALELVAEMRSKGIACNVHTYSALMNVCIKSKELDLALDVYGQMLTEGCTPNLVTFNTLIDVHVKKGSWEDAVTVLSTMESHGVQPEVRTYNTIITACNKAGHWEEGLKIYERMLAAGVTPSATTYTTLISAYGKQGQIDKVLDVYQEMVDKNCERNVITYSSLISACERAGRWQLAIELFQTMHAENCKPNVVTYNSLIAACSNGGQWEKAMEFFNQMCAQGCTPDSITFGALISAYERGGQWRFALRAFEHMHSQGCHPDAVVLNNLLEVLWESGVLYAQMRATSLWSVASRCGQFRIYTQSKADGDVAVYNTSVLTAGAAVVTILRWLAELRHKVGKEGAMLLKQNVLFTVQKSKHNRAEQPSGRIADHLRSMLAGYRAPFVVSLDEQNIKVECASSELVAWLRSPHFAPILFLVQGAGAKRLSIEQLVNADVAVEVRCAEAFVAVCAFEKVQLEQWTPVGQALLFQRTQVVQAAFKFGSVLGFKDETVFDALALLDKLLRTAAVVLEVNLWPLLVCACVVVAGRQVGSVIPYQNMLLLTGFPLEAVVNMESNIYSWTNSNTSAVSPLRVAHLLLERLGLFVPDSKHAAGVAKDVQLVMQSLACDVGLLRLRPSELASAVVLATRSARGHVPFWPSALAIMTGYQASQLGFCVRQVEALLAGQQQQQQPVPQQQQQQQQQQGP